ncbi:MAG TPA: SCO family protein [Bryobacteraceae bacterium]|nr:SCO family protein [Bryobacteraceae bacterium]
MRIRLPNSFCARAITAALAVATALPVAAQQYGVPAMLQGVGIDQKLNSQLPLEATFRDETGAAVRLGSYFRGRPVIVNLVYYQCPMLCNMILTGMVNTLKVLSLEPGRDFDIVTISFDPTETPQLAAAKRATYLKEYNRPGAANAWHFLTGDETQIHKVTGAIGFRYRWDDRQKAWAHASGIFIATPEGRLSRYIYGVYYPRRDVRLSLVEASANKIGTLNDQVLLFCYHYDPRNGKYGLVIMNIIRFFCTVTVICLGTFLILMMRREKRNNKAQWRPLPHA